MTAYALRPSAAGTWVYCHGSVRLCAPLPVDDTPEAQEGTAAHWAAMEPLQGRAVKAGDVAPNGVVVTDEMIEGGALYQAVVLSRIPLERMHIEQELPAPEIHPDNGGTPDIWGFGHESYVLHVTDYKFGHGFVEVFENWQVLNYLSAIFSHLVNSGQIAPGAEQHLTIEFTIVQPRSYHADGPVRSWRVRMDQLRALLNQLMMAAHAAMGENPTTATGPHCQHCEARHLCATLQHAAYNIVDATGQATPFDLNPMQLGNELRWLHRAKQLLDARVDSLEVQALAVLKEGKPLPHYMAQPSTGREVWLEGASDSIVAVADLLGFNLRKPQQLITPTQAKALGIDPAVISEYSHRPRGETKLVPLDSKTTRKIFGGT
jgi:hypothetical protein